LAVVCLSQWAQAEEANVGAVGNVGAAPVTSTSSSERFAAPNGQLGAGLSFSPAQRGRAYAEVGFFHSEPGTEGHVNSFTWILGVGVKVMPNLELEALIPMGFIEGGGGGASDNAFATGNMQLGANYLQAEGAWRLKLGGAVQFGPWAQDYEFLSLAAIDFGHPVGGGQDIGLWAPEVLSLVAPARFEYDVGAVLGADAALGVHIPTNGGDVAVTVQIAPGVGYYVSDAALIGLRVPLTIVPTNFDGGDWNLLAVEPYARYDLGGGFLNARFTVNIDDPYGFSFDEGQIWGLHFGGGATF
jgi:hypothetical protein